MAEKVLKICCSLWDSASRDKRELAAYKELGADVLVMAKGEPRDKFRKDSVDGFDVMRFSTRPLGTKMPPPINRVISIFIWACCAREIKPDIISGHDLSGLLIGWLSTWLISKRNKPKLIYDSHEFELGRNTKCNRLQFLAIKYLEGFLMKRCAFSIMVNDGIADEVQRIHKLEQRPVVVRSTPGLWHIDNAVTARTHNIFCKQLDIPAGSFITMYHGGIMPGRGIETLVKLVARNPDISAVILGDGESEYCIQLRHFAAKLGVEKRVLFLPAIPIQELWEYVGAADAGMITIPATVKSYYYMLPNKFFENIQSETPVICSDFPVIKRLVDQYQIGLTCPPNDIDAISACVERMRTDKAFYAQCKENLKVAKRDLCWENERPVLQEAFRKVISKCSM
jgi:glycosyltransferase involved in cell wall biosynthesis